MAGRIPDSILETIRERCSIVEVVSAHVALKKSGRSFTGLCPFHAEKSPSFTVNEERGLYHCFGCGEGGTVFSFLMKMEGLDFRAAVEQLAQRAGVTLPEDGDAPERDDRRRLFQLNEAAQRRYVEMLSSRDGDEARDYLQRRGLSSEIIERYGLGFCPARGSSFLRAISDRPQAVHAALEIGLVGRRDDGRLYERQWGRITFPIRDGTGRVVGFGGRALGDRQPKYLNSPESTLFHKGSVLYGLYEARQAIRAADRLVIVEGYMDVISLAQFGVDNVVANLGTALTETQLRLARRFAAQVVAFFDGDRAGQAAAMRTFELCAETGVWAYGAFLPEGEDPDSFVRGQGTEATQALLADAVALSEYFFAALDPGPAAALQQRQAAVRRAGDVLGRIADPAQFGVLARAAAERLGVDESAFREIRGAGARRRPVVQRAARPEGEPMPANGPSLSAVEKDLLVVMAIDRGVCGLVLDAEAVDHWLTPQAQKLAHAILDAWDDSGEATGAFDRLPADVRSRATAALLGEGPTAEANKVGMARDYLKMLEERWITARIQQLRREQERAQREGDTSRERERSGEIHELAKRRAALRARKAAPREDVA